MNQYLYDGSVMEFDVCISHNWKSSTHAVSEHKARSNLVYQYKKTNNKGSNAKITLPGKITMIQRKGKI